MSESFDLPVSSADSDSEHDFVADRLPLDARSLDGLDSDLEVDYQRISSEWFAATGGHVGADEESLDMARLSLADGSLAGEDQRKKKVPFFDVAYNYVTAFDMDALAIKAGLRIPTAPERAAHDDTSSPVGSAEDAEDEEEEDVAPPPQEDAQPTPTKRGWGFGLFGRR